MKVYLFEKESGFYLGEDFDSCHESMEDDGKTTVSPPRTGPGEVAVFNRTNRCWHVIDFARRKGGGES